MKIYHHVGGGLDERETVHVQVGCEFVRVDEQGRVWRRFDLPSTAVELTTPAAALEQMLEHVWISETLDVPTFRALLACVTALPGGPEAIEAADWEAALAAYDEAVAG